MRRHGLLLAERGSVLMPGQYVTGS
jgi:hypothetical protein